MGHTLGHRTHNAQMQAEILLLKISEDNQAAHRILKKRDKDKDQHWWREGKASDWDAALEGAAGK